MNKYFNPTPFYLIYNGEFFVYLMLQCICNIHGASQRDWLFQNMCKLEGENMPVYVLLGWLIFPDSIKACIILSVISWRRLFEPPHYYLKGSG